MDEVSLEGANNCLGFAPKFRNINSAGALSVSNPERYPVLPKNRPHLFLRIHSILPI
ncbi:hypothetical protein C0J52_11015 [Blattella germanica]|nr:hypothetical protein C0J52_11015 [Blattella germanica]